MRTLPLEEEEDMCAKMEGRRGREGGREGHGHLYPMWIHIIRIKREGGEEGRDENGKRTGEEEGRE